MEENKNQNQTAATANELGTAATTSGNIDATNEEGEEKLAKASAFQSIYSAIILNWKWFILSLIICLGLAAIYLRYTTPTYKAYEKMLIKGDDAGGSQLNSSTLGIMSNSNGLDNEMEILGSRSLAESVVRDLKLYTTYMTEGRVKDQLVYATQPLTVDLDAAHIDKLNRNINLNITRDGSKYIVTGSYSVPTGENSAEGPYSINKTFTRLPATIPTRAGLISISNNNGRMLDDGQSMKVFIQSPKMAAGKYVGELQVAPTSKGTSIAMLTMTDEIPERAMDYLRQLVVAYNRQANEDKNQVALKTDSFISNRLKMINKELGTTEGQLQNFKEQNGIVELKMNAGNSFSGQTASDQKLIDLDTQIELLNSISDFMEQSSRRYQVIPSNVGLQDGAAVALINKYNELVLERNRLLRSASENSPVVEPITDQIKELNVNIRRAIGQSRKNLEIERNSLANQYDRYSGEVEQTPGQERKLTQIGRQQEVKSGLYLMLLQKREENNISLAATADKGKVIDEPQPGGKVSPDSSMIMLIALLAGLALPSLFIFLVQYFRYKIEGHNDVAQLTRLPIIADVAVASNKAKGKADIVVHANKNNQMEEIFRSMRTNIQFMMKEGQKVILFTSSTSGEGKTFNCANLATSFALLDKKVLILGLDIRRPRLGELFEIDDKAHGITNLLIRENPTEEEILSEIVPSDVNDNLDLMLSGPVPPNPTEILARPALQQVMAVLKKHYDYILIDTAPVGLVTDTLQIARIADVTVYMCRADYTPKSSFELINGLANENKLPNMCIVINGIDMSKKKYGYYYGYGRYGKYGRYAHYGSYRYGRYGAYGGYGSYGTYGSYGNYANSHYGNKKDDSVKR